MEETAVDILLRVVVLVGYTFFFFFVVIDVVVIFVSLVLYFSV
jgi:hypothetical protein